MIRFWIRRYGRRVLGGVDVTMSGSEFSIRVTTSDKIMRLHLSGPAEVSIIARYVAEHMEEMLPYETLWDIRQSDLGSLAYADWKWLLARTRPTAEIARGRRLAILCGSTLQFGLSRMLEELAGMTNFPVAIRAFRIPEQAETWLRDGIHTPASENADV